MKSLRISCQLFLYHTNLTIAYLFDRKGEKIYSRPVLSEDVYQVGYHKALIYRENCYACLYAGEDRCGDLTISDYKGIGRKPPVIFLTEKCPPCW